MTIEHVSPERVSHHHHDHHDHHHHHNDLSNIEVLVVPSTGTKTKLPTTTRSTSITHRAPTAPSSSTSLQQKRKRIALLLFYWAVAAMACAACWLWWGPSSRGVNNTLMWSTSSSKKSRKHITKRPNFTCIGNTADDTRCELRNVVVEGGVIYLFDPKPTTQVPPTLCSTVSGPDPYRVLCNVRLVSDPHEFTTLLTKTQPLPAFERAVALYRLNPTNAYHALYEDMIGVYAMLEKHGNFSSLTNPIHALSSLKQTRWGVFITDGMGDNLLDKGFWQALLPEVALVHPSSSASVSVAYRVEKMYVGTQVNCVHWAHCQPTDRPLGVFDPPEAALALRALVLHRYDIREEGEEGEKKVGEEKKEMEKRMSNSSTSSYLATDTHTHTHTPRITLVQRNTTRILHNLDAIVSLLTTTTGVAPRVIDMSLLSVPEQITLAHHTDIYILVHGGALANMLWLPPGALVIDIYPYEFQIWSQSMIIHWMRTALLPPGATTTGINIGHHPYQVHTSTNQSLTDGPVKEGCVCDTFACQAHVFRTCALITLEVDQFKRHVEEGVGMWKEGKYEQAMSEKEWMKRNEMETKRREEGVGEGVPLCV